MTQTTGSPWAGVKILIVMAVLVGGFALWALVQFGPREIPMGAAPCPQEDWAALNAEGVEFGSIYNSTDRAERNSANGVLVRNGDHQPRCMQIFDDKTCNLVGPTLVQVNRPDGLIVIALDEGQTARLHNNPHRPLACGLLEPTAAP